MGSRKNKPLMRSLGEFVGHILKAAKTKPKKQATVVNRTVEEEERDGGITLRRTTIEEIEVDRSKSTG